MAGRRASRSRDARASAHVLIVVQMKRGPLMRTILSAIATLMLSAFSAVAAPLPDCRAPQHHQFDFWIGRWDVYETQTGKRAGSSLIESLYKGCVLRENWSDPDITGGSLNIYDTADGKWHQMWTDSVGADRLFIGGLENGKMVLVTSFAS